MQDLTVDKRKELKERVRICNKNEKAILDILTLYYHLSIKYNYDNLINRTLLDNIIKELEDEEINVPLQAKSLEDFLRQQSHAYSKIREELENIEMDESLEFLGDPRHGYLLNIYSDYRKKPFNFISKLLCADEDYVYLLLTSEINMEKKVEILYSTILYFIKNRGTISLESFLKPKNTKDSNFIKEKNQKKIEECISYFKIWVEKKKESLKEIIYESKYPQDWLVFLQKNNIVDFIKSKSPIHEENESKKGTYDSKICIKLGFALRHFSEFYELKDYAEIPEKERNKTDLILLENMNIREISAFISLSNFELTEEKIQKISEKVMRYQKEKEEVIPELMREQIINAIMYKAKTEEDSKKMFEYVTKFLEQTDYEKYKESLEIQREANLFLRRLYNKN